MALGGDAPFRAESARGTLSQVNTGLEKLGR